MAGDMCMYRLFVSGDQPDRRDCLACSMDITIMLLVVRSFQIPPQLAPLGTPDAMIIHATAALRCHRRRRART